MSVLVTSSVLYQSYAQVEKVAADNALNVARIAQRSISRNVELLSLALDNLAWRYRHTQIHTMPESQKLDFLLGEKIEASYIAALGIVRADGTLVVGSPFLAEILPGQYSENAFFITHRDQASAGLSISAPLTIRLERRMQAVVLSKRLAQADGSFAGVVFMVLYLDYFRDLFQGLSLEKDGVMSLYSLDGVAYMRLPYNESFIGSRVDDMSHFRSLLTAAGNAPAQGSYFARSRQDSLNRLYAYVRVPDTPWVVFVGQTHGVVFHEWFKMLYAVLFLMAAFAMASLYLLIRLRQEFNRRSKIDELLEEQARVDKLTNLLNRRALDEVLNDAWSKSQRNPTAHFSLLFIDVDFFKHYNDTYGHKAGDYALMAVARCIAGAVSRLSDKAGRYGGEEFLVLLDETDLAGAEHVAERILNAVRTMKIPHQSSLFGRLTVSIGISHLQRGLHQEVEDVIRAADEALYVAKNDGRNRLHIMLRELRLSSVNS
ncbi:MAG: GGDEF domain-containing protein [Herbaspirillum sp.]|nr:GGDEF domain-containing protein [Herbaspirillum sp.]